MTRPSISTILLSSVIAAGILLAGITLCIETPGASPVPAGNGKTVRAGGVVSTSADGNDAAPAGVVGRSSSEALLPWAALLFGLGLWLVLSRASGPLRAAGAVMIAASLGLFAARLPLLAGWGSQGVLWLLSSVTVISGVATISMRRPVYSALWFALALLGTGGLFLVDGAQFLGVATVVIYAGAIVVTFLFVLMLSAPQRQAYYDRLSSEALLSALTGAVLVFVLSLALNSAWTGPARAKLAAAAPGPAQLARGVLVPEHVATFGARLFSQYLVAVEVAGVLLLVALVGASATVLRAWQVTPPAEPLRGPEGAP